MAVEIDRKEKMLGRIFQERKRKTCCACTERRMCTRIEVIWPASDYSPFEHSSENEWVCDPCLETEKERRDK